MPLFDPGPKARREDLYDRERELETLINAVEKCEPLILLLGPRRCGKTSLLQVALNECRVPNIVLDCRVFEERIHIRYADLMKVLEKKLNEFAKPFNRVLEFLRRVRGIRILGSGIEFETYSVRNVSLTEIFEALSRWAEDEGRCLVIAFDEAQELSKLRGATILPTIAYAYDYLRNLSFVFTGSMMGLLYRFLKLDDPRSPLYGRGFVEVRLAPFPREQAVDFLIKGFREHGVEPPIEVLEYAVDRLDGVPGWLTLFGYTALNRGRIDREIVDEVLEIASGMVLEELKHFLEPRYQAAKRYLAILRAVAQGFDTWSKIKKFLEVEEGSKVSDSDLYLLLKNLLDASILRKEDNEYRIADPVLAYAILRKTIRLDKELS